MNRENLPAIKTTTIIDKIKSALNKMFKGHQTEQPFINNTLPNYEKINSIKMMEILRSEIKLRNVIKNNSKLLTPTVSGITQKDAENILIWVVQNARESLFKYDKEENDTSQSLQGLCGLGQSLTAIPLMNMGLKPNINQMAKIIDEVSISPHALVTVSMPVMDNEILAYKPYLIDTTFRQFFQTNGSYMIEKNIRDRHLGNVTPNEGYFLSKREHGTELANELLEKGFVELTSENAKLYCDAFANAATRLKTYKRAPTSKELETGVLGKEYIQRLYDVRRQPELDFEEPELELLSYNVKTPFQQEQMNLIKEEKSEIQEIDKKSLENKQNNKSNVIHLDPQQHTIR